MLLKPVHHVCRVSAVSTRLTPREPGVKAGRALPAGPPAGGGGSQLEHTQGTARQRLTAVGTAENLAGGGGGQSQGLGAGPTAQRRLLTSLGNIQGWLCSLGF